MKLKKSELKALGILERKLVNRELGKISIVDLIFTIKKAMPSKPYLDNEYPTEKEEKDHEKEVGRLVAQLSKEFPEINRILKKYRMDWFLVPLNRIYKIKGLSKKEKAVVAGRAVRKILDNYQSWGMTFLKNVTVEVKHK